MIIKKIKRIEEKMVLIPCEFSGIVRDAFIKRGIDAISCDILPTESPGPHYQGLVEDILYSHEWKAIIAFPPCTYLSNVGNRWFNIKRYGVKNVFHRYMQRYKAVEFFLKFVNHLAPYICIENPVGIMSTLYRNAKNNDPFSCFSKQIICPTFFNETIPKKTCLWLKKLPPLMITKYGKKEYRIYQSGKKAGKRETPLIYDNINLPPEERKRIRSLTFPGIAEAMADQWGDIIRSGK
jgi:hypothetical protein